MPGSSMATQPAELPPAPLSYSPSSASPTPTAAAETASADPTPEVIAEQLTDAREQRAAASVVIEPTFVPRPTPTPTPAPTPAPAAPAPPEAPQQPSSNGGGSLACRYDDVLASRTAYSDWQTTLVDTIFMLPGGYAPGDLVDSSAAGLNGGYALRSLVVADLAAMARDAATAGVPLRLVSGYRSYSTQVSTFNYWVSVGGYQQALRTSARPGHSEHQLGTTMDITGRNDGDPWNYSDWASTPTGAWLAAHAAQYGFVMSYPRGAYSLSCYDYEPWHYRYVGRDLAAAISASGLVPRQYLIGHYGP